MTKTILSILSICILLGAAASSADDKKIPPISVVPQHGRDYASTTWSWVVPAFNKNFDIEYEGKKYLKIGMSQQFIDEQESLIKGLPGYLGYAYTKDGNGFPPISMIQAIRLARIGTKLFHSTGVNEIKMLIDGKEYSLVHSVAVVPNTLKRVWVREVGDKRDYALFEISELVPREYEPLAFLRILNLQGYNNVPPSPQLYLRAKQKLLSYGSEYLCLRGVMYSQPANAAESDRLRRLSKNDLVALRKKHIDLEALLFLRKDEIPSSLVKKMKIAKYGNGETEFILDDVDPRFHRKVDVISTLMTKPGVGLILERVRPEYFTHRSERIEPHKMW